MSIFEKRTKAPAKESPCVQSDPPSETKKSTEKVIYIPKMQDGFPLAYQYNDINLYITEGEEPNFSEIEPGMPVKLVQEPANTYDKKAVYAEANGIKIGYLYKGVSQNMTNDFINGGFPIISYVSSVDDNEHGIKLFMAYYKNKRRHGTPKVFKLTGNANDEMQSNILFSANGDEVSVRYDYDKEKYLVSNELELGYLPKSANDSVNGSSEGYIEEISENDNGKYIVKVTLFID